MISVIFVISVIYLIFVISVCFLWFMCSLCDLCPISVISVILCNLYFLFCDDGRGEIISTTPFFALERKSKHAKSGGKSVAKG